VVDELEAEVAGHGFGRFADVVGIAHERMARP
jgi:dihydroorotate dehydrogenase (NAD+) catalytic subunit